MNNVLYYLNRQELPSCPQIPTRYTKYLDKNNCLSEFITSTDKEAARFNLGIPDIINELNEKIDAKVIERGGVAWDALPTQGSMDKALSSNTIYNTLLRYALRSDLDDNIQLVWSDTINKIDDTYNKIEIEINQLNVDLRAYVDDLRCEFDNYTTYINQQFNEFKTEITEEFNRLEEDVNTKVAQLQAFVNEKVAELLTFVNTKISELENYVNTTVTNLLTELRNEMNELNTTVNSNIAELRQWVNTYVTTTVNDLRTFVNNKVQELETSVNNDISELRTFVLNSDLELRSYLDQKVSNLEEFVNTLVSQIREEMTDLLENVQTTLDEFQETKYVPLEARMTSIELLMETFLQSVAGGTALTDEFGDSEYIGVNLKVLTNSINKIWEKLSEISGEEYKGITLVVTPEYFIGEDGCEVNIKASTEKTNGIFEHIELYINGEKFYEEENVEYLELNIHVDETSVLMVKAKILGIEYTQMKTITHYNSFWLGAGTSYEDVMNVEHVIPITNGMKGNYNIYFRQNDHLFVIVGDTLREGFARADMNGMEIPFTESEITVNGNTYKVFTSNNTYRAGTYNIDVNS